MRNYVVPFSVIVYSNLSDKNTCGVYVSGEAYMLDKNYIIDIIVDFFF